ncbi:MAG TPA: CBS domain-containing protein [Kofleriaceae bacterium]
MRRLQKTIEEIGWTKSVPRFSKTDMVGRAFDAMSRESHECVVIIEDDQLAGIFTSRDFLNRVAARRRDPQKLPLGEVMTPSPRTLRPRDGVAFAINWMALEGFRNVPIVDDDGKVLGVLTVWDVMRHLNDVFDEIEATPRPTPPKSDISEVISMVDLGGGG